ncbi:MAG: hypothetical protein ACI959_000690 [Limisphaerales bacterium]
MKKEDSVSFPIKQYRVVNTVRKRYYEYIVLLLSSIILALLIYKPITERKLHKEVIAIVDFTAKGSGVTYMNYHVEDQSYAFAKGIMFRNPKKGVEFKLLYQINDPSDVKINSFLGYWFPLSRITLWIVFSVIAAGTVASIALIFEPGKLK